MSIFATLEPAIGSLLATVLTTLLQGSLMLAAVLTIDRALVHRSAALRHGVWTATFAALLLLPLASTIVPAWELPEFVSVPIASEAVLGQVPAGDEHGARAGETTESSSRQSSARVESDLEEMSNGSDEMGQAGGVVIPWTLVLAGIWLLGAVTLMVRLSRAAFHATRTCRRGEQLDSPEWLALAERCRRQLGLQQPVRLVSSADVGMPMTWGVRSHSVLLPPEAEEWSEERREVVLMHELAHVRRGDCASQLVSAAALRVALEQDRIAGASPDDIQYRALVGARGVRIPPGYVASPIFLSVNRAVPRTAEQDRIGPDRHRRRRAPQATRCPATCAVERPAAPPLV